MNLFTQFYVYSYNLIKNLLNLIIDLRVKLREKKFYDISDTIRDRLRELGIDIEDKKVN